LRRYASSLLIAAKRSCDKPDSSTPEAVKSFFPTFQRPQKEAAVLMEDTRSYWLYMKGIMDKQKEEMERREVEEMV
jgi:hypothetical protein